jgi:hypothetical protein
MRDAWDELMQRCAFVGGECVPVDVDAVEKRRKARLPTSYGRLMETFGPGKFNHQWRIHRPAAMQSWGEKLKGVNVPKKWKSAVEDNADQLVFASADHGDALAFRLRDLKRGEPDIFHLPPKSWQWRPVGKGVLGVVERIAERNLVFDRGPARPWFVRARPRKVQLLTFATHDLPELRALDRWRESATADGGVTLLDGDGRPDAGFVRWVLLVADTIVHVQAVRAPKGGCEWMVLIDGPPGKLPPAARELLDGGAELGWTSTGVAAAFKAARPKTVAADT